MQDASRTWYLATLKPGRLQLATRNLERQNASVFMPERIETTVRRGRTVQRRAPLFPGYLFVAPAHRDGWGPLRHTLGVSRLITRANGAAQAVPADFIAALLERCDATGLVLPDAGLEVGDTVTITRGLLHGMVGEIIALGPKNRVAVLLEVMGRAVRTEAPLDSLERRAAS